MALPNPNPGGGGTAVIQFPGNFANQENKYRKDHLELLNDGFNSMRSSMDVLSKNIADLIFFLKGESAEEADLKSQKRDVKDVAGSVAGKDNLFGNLKDLGIGFGDILLGAIAAYALGIDKYIRTVFLAKTITQFAKIPEAFASISKAIKESKLFKELSRIIKYYTAPLQNIVNGFKNIGKELQAFGKTVTVSFKELNFMGKIGAVIRKIVNPFISFFKIFGQLTGITGTVSKIAPMFAKIMPILKGIGSKLLLPLFAIFDFVSGFIQGFASKGEGDTRSTMERLLDGLAGGFIKMIKGIFIVPLDLLKQGVEWIARQMGFEKFADALGTFSFEKTFDKLIKFGKNLFSSEPEEGYFSIVKFMADKVQAVKNWFDTLMTDPVKAIMDLAKDYIKMYEDFGGWLYDNTIGPALNWIGKKFGFDASKLGGEEGEGLGDFVGKKIGEIWQKIKNIFSKMFSIEGIKEAVGNLVPDSVKKAIDKLQEKYPQTQESVDETYMPEEPAKPAKPAVVRELTKSPPLTTQGTAMAAGSSAVGSGQRKESGGKNGGGQFVDASTKSIKGGDSFSVSVAQGKPAATSGDLPLGTFGPSF